MSSDAGVHVGTTSQSSSIAGVVGTTFQNNSGAGVYVGNAVRSSGARVVGTTSQNNSVHAGTTSQNSSDAGVHAGTTSQNNSGAGVYVSNVRSSSTRVVGTTSQSSSGAGAVGTTFQNDSSADVYVRNEIRSSGAGVHSGTTSQNSGTGIHVGTTSQNDSVHVGTTQNNMGADVYAGNEIRSRGADVYAGTTPQNDTGTGVYDYACTRNVDILSPALLTLVRQLKMPTAEVKRFSGEPIEYRKFIRQFHTKVVINSDSDDEKMSFLEQFTIGEANRIVSGFSHLPAEQGYPAALKELETRYGDTQLMATAFIKRALDWPTVRADNAKALDDFSILLVECENAVKCIQAVRVLEYPDNMKRLVGKLPFHLHDKWRNLVQQTTRKGGTVQFCQLVNFVKDEARKANDPTYGKEAMNFEQKVRGGKGQFSKQSGPSRAKGSFATDVSSISKGRDPSTEIKDHSGRGNWSASPKPKDLSSRKTCIHCDDSTHMLDKCKKLSALPMADRTEFVKSKGLCFGCLKAGHQWKNCVNKSTCATCKRRHPTVLHDDNRARRLEPGAKAENSNGECANFAKSVCGHTRAGEGKCTMAIIPVQVKLKNGIQSVKTYAFLDPGSSITFCSESLVRQLGGTGQHMSITLDTMGNPFTMHTYAVDGLQVCDLNLENEINLPRVYTKESIPVSQSHIPTNKDISQWKHLEDICLPEIAAEIGLLVGNNVADAYTPSQVKTGPRGSPHAAKTLLGWVVWNLAREEDELLSQNDSTFPVNRAEVVAVQEMEQLDHLDKLVRESINLDFPERLVDDKKEHSQNDKRFLDLVSSSITHSDGHYCIGLPFVREDVKLPDNKSQALQRLESLKRKLQRNPTFYKDYTEFMSKILDSGYAEQVPKDELSRSDGRVWYIPHHGVYHPRKPDKIRVVFDCAATYLGTSLNNLLLQGPDLTNSLLGVLFRFRQEEIAIMGDIEAMFFQVQVPKKDSDCLRFYWWPEGNLKREPLAYRMLVHLFGAVSSPSCSSFTLRQTAEDNSVEFEATSIEVVKRNFYVDDCLVSVGSEAEATSLIENTRALCQRGGFRLTKWITNNHEVLESVPVEERAKDVKELNLEKQDLPNERALGVYWFVESDTLGFKIQHENRPPTRRGILSLVSSVYDPLGIGAPFVLKAKMLLQELCRRNIGWDEEIHGNDLVNWQQWLSELPDIEKLKLRRCYKPPGFGKIVTCQLHNFADASDQGYGMVAYLRLTHEAGHVFCSFLTGKARVAPLKKMTIPRMKLTAATAAVRLSQMLVKDLDYQIDNTYYWTDSMTVLRYVANETSRFHTFVANRIAVIREGSSVQQWRYVNTKSNPADCASRGLPIKKFLQSKLWFEGPDFLSMPETEWPNPPAGLENLSDDDLEVKCVNTAILVQPTSALDRLIEHYSEWSRLKKAVAWLLLGFDNLRIRVAARERVEMENEQQEPDMQIRSQTCESVKRKVKQYSLVDEKKGVKAAQLTVEHLRRAERAVVYYVQRKHFTEEIELLERSQSGTPCAVKKSSSLTKLDPKLVDGLLRVGGRLDRADTSYDAKHPALLPKHSPVAKLILQDIHKSVGHMGKNSILAELRQRYWIIGATSLIKSIVSKCVTCRRYQAPAGEQKMANLPVDRLIADEPPFSRVGMDFFGPFAVKRGRSVVKRYGVVFTCLTIRAVHLELAHSLDTDSCIHAIRRFIARRGTVRCIRSDNGTNLVGSEREMREEISNWNVQKINSMLLQKAIGWEFNPPTGSHFGGVWERLIRLVRKILYSLLREQNVNLDDESLQTLFCEVEAILNSRPITEGPNSPNDLDVLTPNHLILLRSGEQLPPGLFHSSDNYAKRRWRQVQYLADMFWKRWVREYLPLLQERQKWNRPKRNLAIGDIVLIMDTTPRNSWALGRVLEVVKDKKGLVRMVKLRTKHSTLTRPVANLCLLLEGDTDKVS